MPKEKYHITELYRSSIFGVVDVGDGIVDSGLAIDNVAIQYELFELWLAKQLSEE